MRLSRLLDDDGNPRSSDPDLQKFAERMRNPENNRRVHPDIADMHPRATDRTDDWGWFDIKPMARLRRAVEEIDFYYLSPLWNPAVESIGRPDWKKGPGVWQPCLIFVTPFRSGQAPVLFVAITMVPGAIGYLTYELDTARRAAETAIMSVLTTLFLSALVAALRQLIAGGPARRPGAVVELLACVILLVLVGFLISSEIILPAAVAVVLAVLLAKTTKFLYQLA